MLRLTAFAQDGTITIKREYVLALIHDVKKLHACDSINIGLRKDIANADSLLHNHAQQIIILTEQRDIAQNALNTGSIRYDLLKVDSRARLKQSRLKSLKIALVAIGEAVIIVLLVL